MKINSIFDFKLIKINIYIFFREMFTLHTTLGFNDINYLVLSKERLWKRKEKKISFPIEEKKKRRKFAWIYVLFAFLFYLLQPILEIG